MRETYCMYVLCKDTIPARQISLSYEGFGPIILTNVTLGHAVGVAEMIF